VEFIGAEVGPPSGASATRYELANPILGPSHFAFCGPGHISVHVRCGKLSPGGRVGRRVRNVRYFCLAEALARTANSDPHQSLPMPTRCDAANDAACAENW
jgi:hypothetical protein